MQLVWFKRDLRIEHHLPLVEAAARGPVLPLYILEPSLWQQPDMSSRHYHFLCESLVELDAALHTLGQRLIIRVGDAVEVLRALMDEHNITALWSHQETWNGWSYARDKHVAAFLKSRSIPWHEKMQHGVIRALADRDGWSRRWNQHMAGPLHAPPASLMPVHINTQSLPSLSELGLVDDGCIYRQKGGRKEALILLRSFLHERGEPYSKAMSSPLTAYDACSRLSPHFAFGTLSIAEALHAAKTRRDELKDLPKAQRGTWLGALSSFTGRLRWHCHFIQKLEDEPRIEFEHFHSAYDGVRVAGEHQDWLHAWQEGVTGYPMVDACMRALKAHGWINFRMRAMLMSFASYHLWQHFRDPALHLARLFTDYEPGIHYSQAQMQSGTTGMNTLRIYNPIKQGRDHDPQGVFVKEWVPELKDMPLDAIHTPWQAPMFLGTYPKPIVDEQTARKAAAATLYGLRKGSTHKDETKTIVHKHGSRKSGIPRTVDKKPKGKATVQLI